MRYHRPPPELIAARRLEIKRRYAHHAKVGKRTRSMAAIRLAELSRWLDHTNGSRRPIAPSDHAETIARIFVNHFVTLADGNRRAAEWITVYCPWIVLRDREYLIGQANHHPLKWSADKLAWKLRLTDAIRMELKITTIGAIDCNKDQRAKRRRAQRAKLMRDLRSRRKAEAP